MPHGETLACLDKYESEMPSDLGGPNVINRATTQLSTLPKMKDPKDNLKTFRVWETNLFIKIAYNQVF